MEMFVVYLPSEFSVALKYKNMNAHICYSKKKKHVKTQFVSKLNFPPL